MGKKGGKKKHADVDDDALLSAYRADQDKVHSAEVTPGVEVTPRANAAFCAEEGAGRVWLFGGECFHGDVTTTYGDLFFWDVAAAAWSRVSPAGARGPCPRNGHQGVVCQGGLFIFGGERTSRDGCDISHLGDLWRLDLRQLRWNEVPQAPGVRLPSQRSGHRVTGIGGGAFAIFGGYHDTGRSKLKKFNDLHLCTVDGEQVTCRAVATPGAAKPSARSGCCCGGRGGTLCVYGGVDAANRPLSDLWVIELRAGAAAEPAQWREVEFSAGGLGPRTGLSLAAGGDGPAWLFGGLTERRVDAGPGRKKRKEATFHGDLWACDLAARSFAAQHADPPADGGRQPRGRMSGALSVCGGSVFLYGGVVEVDRGQETLGDLWARPLGAAVGAPGWRLLAGDGGRGLLGEDDEEGDDDDASDGVDDARTDDGLPFGYGVDAPLRVPRRLQEWSKGAVAQFNAWHYAMMNDAGRNAFYRDGLRRAVAAAGAGACVVDVGAGGGLLSLLAARAGAAQVVGVEAREELAAVARENVARNGEQARVRVLHRVSTELAEGDLAPAGRAAVVVHELFGALLLGERSLRFVADVRDRLGAGACRVVPRHGAQYATLVECAELDAVTGIAPRNDDGLDLRYCDVLRDTCGVHFTKALGLDLGAASLRRLSDRVAVAEVDYQTMRPGDVATERVVTLPVVASGRVSAVLLTWEARLEEEEGGAVAGPALDTEPGSGGAARAAAWGQALCLVERPGIGNDLPLPAEVEAGQAARLAVRFSADLSQMQCELLGDEEGDG